MRRILLILIFCFTGVLFGQVSILSKSTTNESCYGAKDGKAKIVISFPANQFDRIIYNRVDGTSIPPTTFNIDHKNIPSTTVLDSVDLTNLPGQKNGFTIFFYKNNVNKALLVDTVVIAPGLLVDTAVVGVGALNQNIAVCKGNTIKLFASSTNGTSYNWYNAKNNITNVNSQNTTILNSDLSDQIAQNVYVTAIGNQGVTCTSDTVSITPSIIDAIVADFTLPVGICNNNSITLQPNAISAGADSYDWTMQNGSPATQTGSTPFSVLYNTSPGNYNITLITTTGSCKDTLTKQIAIRNTPTGAISTNSTRVCNGLSANLTFTFTGTGPFAYTYTDGTTVFNGTTTGTSKTATVSVVVTNDVTYTLTSVADQGCPGTITTPSVSIQMSPLPVITSWTFPTVICINGGLRALNAIPTGGVYTISPTSASISANNFDPKISGIGNKTITYTFTDANNCQVVDTRTFSVVNKTTSSIATLPTLCANGSPITLTGTPAGGVFSIPAYPAAVTGTTLDPTKIGGGITTTLRYIYTDGNACRDTVTTNVPINQFPIIGFSTADATLCAGKTMTLRVSRSGGTNPWSFVYNDGSDKTITNTTANPFLITINPLTTTSYILKSGNDSRCTAAISSSNNTVNVTVRPLPVLTITSNAGPYCTQASPINLTATPVGGSFSGSGVSGSVASGFVFTPANSGGIGTKTLTYKYIDPTTSCNDSIKQVIDIRPVPTSTFTVAPELCIGSDTLITYTGNSTSAATYNWSFDSPSLSIGTGQGPYNTTWNTSGSKNITLSVSEYSCTSTITSRSVLINPLPTADMSGDQGVCQGDNAKITINLTGTAPWNVSFRDNTTNAISSVVVSSSPFVLNIPVSTSTTYSLVSVRDSKFCFSSTNVSGSARITVVPKPTSDFNIPSNTCENQLTNVNYASTPSATATYNWIFGSATVESGSGSGVYSLTWPSIGTKTIRLVVNESSGCISDTTTKTIFVNPLPSVVISNDTAVCLNSSANVKLTFTGTAPFTAILNDDHGNTYNVSSATNVLYYPVNVTTTSVFSVVPNSVTDAFCTGSGSGNLTVIINPLPTGVIATNSKICAGQSTSFDLTFTGTAPFNYSYKDASGNVFSGTSATNTTSVSVSPTNTTTYTLVSVQDALCSGTGTGQAVVTVVQIPIADFSFATSPAVACVNIGTQIIFTGTTSPGSSYTWDFDGGTVSSGINEGPYIVSWPTTNTYNVSLSVTDQGCNSAKTTKLIKINPEPLGEIVSNDTTICSGDNVFLKVQFTGVAPYSYTYTDGTTTSAVLSTSNTIDLQLLNPSSDKMYSLVSVSDQACSASSTNLKGTMVVSVKTKPTATFTVKNNVCENESINVNYTGANSGLATFDWGTFDGAVIASGSNFGPYDISYTTEGTKNIKLIVSENGCKDSTSQTVTVTPVPTAVLAGDTTICSGTSAFLKFTFTGKLPLDYTISGISQTFTTNSLTDKAVVSPSLTTTYNAMNVVDKNGCVGVASGVSNVKVNASPQFDFTVKPKICKNEPAQVYLNITSVAALPWSASVSNLVPTLLTTKNGSSLVDTLSFAITQNETVNVTLKDSNNCSTTSTIPQLISIREIPKVDFLLDPTICLGENTFLSNNEAFDSTYTYSVVSPGSSISGSVRGSFLISWSVAGKQYVDYTVNDGVCSSLTIRDSIFVNDLPSVSFGVTPTAVCEGDQVSVTANFIGVNPFDFRFNIEGVSQKDSLGFNGNSASINVTINSTGVIGMDYVKDANGCTNNFITPIQVVINPKPNILINGLDFAYCIDDAVDTLVANMNVTYDFSSIPTNTYKYFGDNKTFEFYPATAGVGVYTFKATATNSFGCSRTISNSLNVVDVSDASFSLPLNNCNNVDSVVTIFVAKYGNFTSDIPGLVFNNIGNILPSLSTPGTYQLTHTLSLGGCPNGVQTRTVNIRKAPQVPVLANLKDTIVCKQTRTVNNYMVLNTEAGVNYSWDLKHNTGLITSNNTDSSDVNVVWTNNSAKTDTLSISAISQYCSADTTISIYSDSTDAYVYTVSDSTFDYNYIKLNYHANSTFPKKDSLLVLKRSDLISPWMVASKQPLTGDTAIYDMPVPSTSETSWYYAVAVKNYCKDTIVSAAHKTILLNGQADVDKGDIMLKYTKYSGWVPQKYEIWRKTLENDTFKLYSVYSNPNFDTLMTYKDIVQDSKEQCFRVVAIFDSLDVKNKKVPSYSNTFCFTFKNTPKIFNVFTPNNDGKNEFLWVDNIKSYPDNEIFVFNRWGNKVYHKMGYNNDWDGGGLPDGTYFYLFKYTDVDDNKSYELKGNVLIVR